MAEERKRETPGMATPPAWRGARNRPGAPDDGPEADSPAEEAQATRDEEGEAAEHTPDYPTGRRGDLGDSGPGED